MRGAKVATTDGWWLLSKFPECSTPKTTDDSLEAYACCPYITSYPTHKHNIHDITK